MNASRLRIGLAAMALVLLAGCDYEVPLTAGPTQPVNPRLVGDWVSHDPDDNRDQAMSVRALDDFNYVVTVDGDIYRAFHSDLAKLPFVSVQDLNSSDRKFVYFTWLLSNDGTRLTLRRVAQEVVPDSVRDPGEIQRLVTEHAADPKLLGKDLVFTRRPAK